MTSPLISSRFEDGRAITLATSDALAFLKTLPSNSAQMILTSPPYNIGKAYETRISLDEYICNMRPIIAECVRVVKHRGSICWEVGHHVHKGRSLNLAFEFYPEFKLHEASGLTFRNAIIWHFQHGKHALKRFSGRYETVLWYTKGNDDSYIFNLDDVRVPQKYPGKRHFKGPRRGEFSGNPLGKNPGDVWIDIPNVKANHVEKTEHPCQFPVGLAERLILALSRAGDLVVDPFIGVGSTAVAAIRTGRRAAGCDLIADYVATARQRVRLADKHELRVRENRPIFVPDSNSPLTQFPDSFCQTDMDQNRVLVQSTPSHDMLVET